jgi:uncharacterized membrane protein YhaH (DUF805 family)
VDKILEVVILFWFIVMVITGSILLFNLSKYMLDNPFREWHVVLLWPLIIPISTMAVLMMKYKNQLKK